MPSLLDELRADQDPRAQCRVCRWIESLKPAEQAEWDAAMSDRSFTHASIYRALSRRESGCGRSGVESHRTSKHRQKP